MSDDRFKPPCGPVRWRVEWRVDRPDGTTFEIREVTAQTAHQAYEAANPPVAFHRCKFALATELDDAP